MSMLYHMHKAYFQVCKKFIWRQQHKFKLILVYLMRQQDIFAYQTIMLKLFIYHH